MMREFLFRGKRTDNCEWVCGDLIHREIWSRDVCVIRARASDDGFDAYVEYEVIPETVGQYTGLRDRNDVKIFEGDIVEYYFFDMTMRNSKSAKVKNAKTILIGWVPASFYMTELFRNYRLEPGVGIITERIYDYKGNKKQGVYKTNDVYFVEVIGNLYENREVLVVAEQADRKEEDDDNCEICQTERRV